ncbi:MAG: O-antigen ligase family protein [Patescibacteria group bacterium]|jgi:O-antigen ligase/tetratricopeptide (TPR) repeat protein
MPPPAPGDMQHTIYDTLNELLLVLLLVFMPLACGAVHPWAIAIFEVAAALMAFFWILEMASRGQSKCIGFPILALFLILIGDASVQLFFSHFPLCVKHYTLPTSIYPWATKTEILKLVAYAMIFLVTLNTLRTKAQIKRVMGSIVIIGFFMSIFFLMDYFGVKMPVGFINADHFSAYLGMIIPLALGLLLVSSPDSDLRPLLFFFVLIMSAALFFTMSRGGMFSFIAALLFVAWLVSTRRSMKKKGWILWVIAVLIALIIAWLGAIPVMERILSIKAEIASRYFGGRLPIWQGTLGIIQDHPAFGTGLGTFNDIFPQYQPFEIIRKHYTYAHSDILELLSEIGIVGFALFLVAGLGSLVYLFRRYRKRHDPWVVGLSICVFGSLASIFSHSFTDFNLHIPANAILLTVILALFISILKTTEHETSSQEDDPRLPTSDSDPPTSGHRLLSYPVAILVAGLLVIYVIAVVRPAMANHYVQFSPSDVSNFKLAVRLDPLNAGYHYRLGKLYSKQHATYGIQPTIDEYAKTIELNPTNSQYHQSLAWVFGQMKNVNAARQEFEVAIKLMPNFYYPYQVYAEWLFNHPTKENIKKGVEVYRQAVVLNPQLAGKALSEYFKIEKSYAQLKKILADTPENHGKIMTMLLDAGLWEANKSEFEKDREAASYKYPYYKALSRYYEKMDDGIKSIKVLKDYLKIDPNCADAHFYVADRLAYLKPINWQKVFSHYESALALAPENTFYREWYARHLFYAKKYDDAIAELEKVVAKDWWNVELIRLLGDWYKSVGRIKDADAMDAEASRVSESLINKKK